jgi:hypothetical protein
MIDLVYLNTVKEIQTYLKLLQYSINSWDIAIPSLGWATDAPLMYTLRTMPGDYVRMT